LLLFSVCSLSEECVAGLEKEAVSAGHEEVDCC